MVNNLIRIKQVIKNCKMGCTISDIAKKANCSRNTARTYVERLIGEGKVNIRKIGPAKLVTYKRR